MSHHEPIDWSKVITDRPPPVRPAHREATPERPDVFDLLGPSEPLPEHPEHRRDAKYAS